MEPGEQKLPLEGDSDMEPRDRVHPPNDVRRVELPITNPGDGDNSGSDREGNNASDIIGIGNARNLSQEESEIRNLRVNARQIERKKQRIEERKRAQRLGGDGTSNGGAESSDNTNRSPIEPEGRIIRKGRGGLRHLRTDSEGTSDIDASSRHSPLEPQGRKARHRRNNGTQNQTVQLDNNIVEPDATAIGGAEQSIRIGATEDILDAEGKSSVKLTVKLCEQHENENEQTSENEMASSPEATSSIAEQEFVETINDGTPRNSTISELENIQTNKPDKSVQDIGSSGGKFASAPLREDIEATLYCESTTSPDVGKLLNEDETPSRNKATLAKPGAVAVTYDTKNLQPSSGTVEPDLAEKTKPPQMVVTLDDNKLDIAETEGESSVQQSSNEQNENEQVSKNEVTAPLEGSSTITATEQGAEIINDGKIHNTTSESDQLDSAHEHIDKIDNSVHDIGQSGGKYVSAPSREDVELGEVTTKPGAVAMTYDETPPKNPEHRINDSEDTVPEEGKASNENETPAKNPAYRINDDDTIDEKGSVPNNDSALDATATRASTETELPTAIEAYTVGPSDEEVVVATPVLPWWKQRKVKLLLIVLAVVIVALAIALGVSLSSQSSPSSSSPDEEDQVAIVEKSIETPSISPTATLQLKIVSPTMPPTVKPFGSMKLVTLLPDDNAGSGHQFGQSISIFKDTLVVGARYGRDGLGGYRSIACIYQRGPDTNSWTLQQNLMPDDNAYIDEFGSSVAVYDSTIVVGAIEDSYSGENIGSVYIYQRDPDTNAWAQQQKLVPDDGVAFAEFGFRLAIYGNTIVVGAPWDGCHDGVESSGSIHIYQQDLTKNKWTLQQKLVPPDGAASHLFGFDFAIYQNTIVVSAFDNDEAIGGAQIYNRDLITDEWSLQQKLVPDDGFFSDRPSVAIFNNTIIVGTKHDDYYGEVRNSAWIYVRDMGTNEWTLHQHLLSPGLGSTDDMFGYSVAIFDNTAVVGAEFDEESGGSVFIYIQDDDANEWNLQEKIVADDGVESFGNNVAIFDRTVAVSAYFPDQTNGVVHVYSD